MVSISVVFMVSLPCARYADDNRHPRLGTSCAAAREASKAAR